MGGERKRKRQPLEVEEEEQETSERRREMTEMRDQEQQWVMIRSVEDELELGKGYVLEEVVGRPTSEAVMGELAIHE